MGKPERDAATHLLSFFPDLPPHFTIDHYLSSRRTIQDLLWPTVRPLPGVTKLIRHLHHHKIPIAVATSSQRRNFILKSSHLTEELFGYFEGKVICADDGQLKPGRGKPCPDIFLLAAKTQLERDVGDNEEGEGEVTEAQIAERAKGLVFEDAIPGVQAGKRAGMKVVWVPDPNLLKLGNGDNLENASEKPDLQIHSVEEFVPEEWGLPPYDSDS